VKGEIPKQTLAQAYMQSWFNVPNETATFLRVAGLTKHAPEILLDRDYRVPVGTLVCLQEPSLKARWISNPNRITQSFLRPLGEAWAGWLERFPTDCTKLQERGVIWASTKLSKGVTLASADLTSATDKLSLEPCLDIVHRRMCGNTLQEMVQQNEGFLKTNFSFGVELHRYLCAVKHFADVSRGAWLLDGNEFAWKAGWPLGTRPSFPLLGLTNNIVAMSVAEKLGIPWKDSFRVLGDDIVMDARMMEEYTKRIEALGGVVNPDKSIISNRVAEFAGRVIDRHGSYLKRVKVREISDDSFMEFMSQMGEQAKWLLRPRQRRVWDELKYSPGFIVGGPRSQEAHGEALSLRVEWHERYVAQPRVEPDPVSQPAQQMALQMVASIQEHLPEYDLESNAKWFFPQDLWEGVHPSKTTRMNVQESSDPRRIGGRSALEVAEARINDPTFVPYQTFKESHCKVKAPTRDGELEEIPVEPPVSKPEQSPPEISPQPVRKRKGR